MNRVAGILLGVLLVGALAAGLWWYWLRPPVPPDAGQPSVASTATEQEGEDATAEEPVEEYPVPDTADDHGPSEQGAEPQAEAPEPLPTLEESDGFMRSILARLLASGVVEDWLKDERIVERLVVTINSMDGPASSLRFWPVRHIEGLPVIEQDGDTLRWSEANVERYRPLVRILQSPEPEEVARAYFRSYPLFQQAYDSLGLEDAHFNDRLVEIVDHLLGAPVIEPGFEVKQPKVLYEFADPELEAESWGRKLLMRMGPDNAAAVRKWLRALRRELVAGKASVEEASDTE
jgi:hypothetical protein